MKQFIKDKKRVLIIALAVVLLISVTGYAMTVDSFTDYNPPDYLYIHWYDYMKDDVPPDGTSGAATVNNTISNHPRWSVEYPYRAIFLGGTPAKVIDYYVVYSKEPSTDLFTFEYISGNKSTYQIGRIRAYISSNKIGAGKDFRIFRVGHNSDGTPSLISGGSETRFDVSGSGVGTSNGKAYFSFDFFYDCASEHQQYAGDLNISAVTNINGVPYKYVTKCLDHVGGHNTGGSGGDSSSSGNGGLSGDKNTSGNGGKHGWGTGDYGGGVNKNDIVSGNDGGGYTSRPDMELSVPDDWKKPIEDNYNSMPTTEYKPDFPEYIPAEGDTGQTGESWELPTWGDNGGVTGDISEYKELKPNGEQGLIDFMSPMEEWLE